MVEWDKPGKHTPKPAEEPESVFARVPLAEVTLGEARTLVEDDSWFDTTRMPVLFYFAVSPDEYEGLTVGTHSEMVQYLKLRGLVDADMWRKRTVEIDVVVDDKQASGKLKNLGDDAGKSARGFSDMSGGLQAAALGAGAFVASNIVGFLADATMAAAEDELAQKDLALALQNTVGATDAQIESAEAYIKKMSEATGTTDDELRPALETLVRTTGSLDQAQEDLAVAMDIAAATGKPLEAVTAAMGKAALGSVGGLAKLGLQTKDNEGKQLSYNEILEQANELMGGAAEVAAETGAGAIKKLQTAVGELKETFGGLLLPAVGEVAGALSDTVGVADILLGKVDALAGAEGEGVPGFMDSAIALIPVIGQVYAGFQNFETAIGGAHEALSAAKPVMDESTAAQAETYLALQNTRAELGLNAPAWDDLTGAQGEAYLAFQNTRSEVENTTGALREQFDLIDGRLDTFADLTQAVDDQAAAQLAVNEAAAKYGEGSPEHIAAIEDVATANRDLKDAEMKVVEAGGLTRDEFIKQQIEMGTMYDDAVLLADKYNELFTPRTVTHTITTREVNDTNTRTGRHTGGTVPGDYRGQEVTIQARAGEWVSQSGTPMNGYGGGPSVIQLVLDRKVIAEVTREEFVKDNRNGRPWQ